MPKPPPGPVRNSVSTLDKGGESSRPAVSLKSGSSSSPSSSYSSRASTTRVGSPIPLRTQTSKTNDGDDQGLWMETATPGKFSIFQGKIFPIIEFLTSKPEHVSHAFVKKWTALKRTPNIPMTANISWRNTKILLGIQDMFQYRDFLTQCPEFTSFVTLRRSATTRWGFDYGIISNPAAYAQTNELDAPESDEAVVPRDESSYVFDLDVEHPQVEPPQTEEFQVLQVDTASTPRQTNVFQLEPETPVMAEDTDGSLTTNGSGELIEPLLEVAWAATEEATGFRQVHYRLYETVTTWMQRSDAKRQAPVFYLAWQKAVARGLTSLTKWDRVAKLFQLAYLRDYITFMNQCPQIQERYELSYDFLDNTVRYKELALPDTADVLNDITKLNTLQRRLQQLAYKFDSCISQFNTRLGDTDARITSCETNMREQLNRASSRFATSATQPTRRTRHMDIKKFALLEWVEQDLMILKSIKTAENAADGLTKPLAKQLFHRHADTIMGRRVPAYAQRSIKSATDTSNIS